MARDVRFTQAAFEMHLRGAKRVAFARVAQLYITQRRSKYSRRVLTHTREVHPSTATQYLTTLAPFGHPHPVGGEVCLRFHSPNGLHTLLSRQVVELFWLSSDGQVVVRARDFRAPVSMCFTNIGKNALSWESLSLSTNKRFAPCNRWMRGARTI